MQEITRLFESISEKVWEKLARNSRRGNSLFEEGITRGEIIDLIISYAENNQSKKVLAQKAKNEKANGGDLEIYIELQKNKYIRLFLQAKLLHEKNLYNNFAHKNGNGFQWDLITKFANINGCKPLYILYNGIPDYNYEGEDCCGTHDEKQLGCSIAEVSDIKALFNQGNKSSISFDDIHKEPNPIGIPWRCIPGCSNIWTQLSGLKAYNFDEINADDRFKYLIKDEKNIPTEFITPGSFKGMPNVSKAREINTKLKELGYESAARLVINRY
jgi:hypothetical protein